MAQQHNTGTCMAIKIFERYGPRADAASANYPQGSIKNESVPSADDGTPLDNAWANDYEGFTAALLARAAIVPSGTPDTAIASQRLDALLAAFATRGTGGTESRNNTQNDTRFNIKGTGGTESRNNTQNDTRFNSRGVGLNNTRTNIQLDERYVDKSSRNLQTVWTGNLSTGVSISAILASSGFTVVPGHYFLHCTIGSLGTIQHSVTVENLLSGPNLKAGSATNTSFARFNRSGSSFEVFSYSGNSSTTERNITRVEFIPF